MADTTHASDKSLGLSITFGVVTLIATLALLGTSWVYAMTEDHQMQLYAAFAFGAAMVTGSIAVAVIHLYSDSR